MLTDLQACWACVVLTARNLVSVQSLGFLEAEVWFYMWRFVMPVPNTVWTIYMLCSLCLLTKREICFVCAWGPHLEIVWWQSWQLRGRKLGCKLGSCLFIYSLISIPVECGCLWVVAISVCLRVLAEKCGWEEARAACEEIPCPIHLSIPGVLWLWCQTRRVSRSSVELLVWSAFQLGSRPGKSALLLHLLLSVT